MQPVNRPMAKRQLVERKYTARRSCRLTPHTENYAMRPKVDRVTFSSNALQYVGEYVGDIILNLLIVASAFALLMFGILLFSS